MEESLNWGYKTTPQEHCNGRELDYSRGKGLGGGTAINFGVYTVGVRDDYNAVSYTHLTLPTICSV